MIIDTHTHIFEDVYSNDFSKIMQNLKADNLENIFVVGYDLESSKKAVEIANNFKTAFAIIGVHPENAKGYNSFVEEELTKLAQNKKVVAIGEIGLDYFYSTEDKILQQEVFLKQLMLANKLNLPVSIHLRDAFDDMTKLLNENKNLILNGGVMHCFSGDIKTADEYLKMGFYLAFGGKLTFKNAKENVEVLKMTPLNRILLETDCPFLTPVPFRGQRNEPKYCNLVAEKMAEVKKMPLTEIEKITTLNTHNLFKKMDLKWV